MKFVYKILALVLSYFIKFSVQWVENGALNAACSILSKDVLQTIESPYSLTAILLRKGNVKVKIQAVGEQTIGGFIIQGRRVVDDTPVGSFNTANENYKPVACVTESDSTIHINSMSETEFYLLWIPPIEFTGGQIYFIATVLSTFNESWSRIISETIDFSQDRNTSNKIYQLCDGTWKCFESPVGCLVSRTCDAIAVVHNVSQIEQNIWSNMILLKPNYIAFGISNGQSKADISVIECVVGQINLYTSYTEISDPDRSSPQSETSKCIVNLISLLYRDDIIQCVIECDSVTTLHDQEYNLLSVKFYDQVEHHNLALTTAEIMDFVNINEPDRIYDNCDGSRVCFGAPLGCVDQRNCEAVTVIYYMGDTFQFELKTMVASEKQSPAFITFAISDDPSMLDIFVLGCTIGKEDKIHPYISQPEITRTSRLILSSYVDGTIHCLIEGDTVSSDYNLLNEQYYVQIAVGSELHVNSISTHNLIQATSTQKVSLYNALGDIHSIYDDCGITKRCFGHPHNCVNTFDCLAVTAVNFVNNVFQFEMMADNRNESRYVAFGLSNSTGMGNASVIECVVENDAVNVYTSYTEISPIGSPRTDIPQNIVRLVRGSYENGVIHCVVERNTISEVRGQTFDLMNDKYYLLIASGTAVRADSVAEHDRGQLISESQQSLRVLTLATTSSALIKVHGIFMIMAWLGTATIGTGLKRFFNKTKLNDDDEENVDENLWFLWHRICMISTGLLTIIAFIVIFVEIGGWSAESNPHAILGTIVTVICLIQILGGIFRPTLDSKHRIYFKRCHFLSETVAKILATITIIFAISLPKAQLAVEFSVVFGMFRTFFIIWDSLGKVNELCQHYKKEKEKIKKTKGIVEVPLPLIRKIPFGIFTAAIIIQVVTLSVFIGLAP